MTLLIRSVQIVGGDRSFPERSDVFISGDKISAIGSFPRKGAARVIEGQGIYLAPGFIDVHTESDHYLTLFDNPTQEDFLKQGITTIFGGHDGASLAPLISGKLDSLWEWTDPRRVNVNWRTVRELLRVLERRPLGVNFGTLVGYTALRRDLAADRVSLRREELESAIKILRHGLKEGAFGASLGCNSVFGRTTSASEVKAVLKVIKEHNAILATPPKREDFGEFLNIVNEARAKVLLTHVCSAEDDEKNEEVLETAMRSSPETDIRFAVSPMQTASLPLYQFLPKWAQNTDWFLMNKNLNDEWLKPKLLKELPKINPNHFRVARAPKNNYLVGRTLTEFMDFYSLKTVREALWKLMAVTHLHAVVHCRRGTTQFRKRLLAHPRAFVSTEDAASTEDARFRTAKSETATSAFTSFLKLAIRENLMPLDAAVKKVSSEPAVFLGLKRRGVVKEGYFADLVGFNREGGVKFVIVNGRVAVHDGGFQNVLPGRPLKHET